MLSLERKVEESNAILYKRIQDGSKRQKLEHVQENEE